MTAPNARFLLLGAEEEEEEEEELLMINNSPLLGTCYATAARAGGFSFENRIVLMGASLFLFCLWRNQYRRHERFA
jgi:hypothetical protein